MYIRWDPIPYRYDYKLDYIFVLTTLSVGNSMENEEVQSTNLTRLFYKSFKDHLLIKDLGMSINTYIYSLSIMFIIAQFDYHFNYLCVF